MHSSASPKHAPAPGYRTARVPWSTGLWGCFSDLPSCCLTYWCPCVTFGRVAEIVDQGSSSCIANGTIYALLGLVTGLPCLYSCCYRSRMRHQYMLQGDACGACMVHFFCEPCALCQEYRELQNRGFNMSIGWEGNCASQRRTCQITNLPPSVHGGMNR